jgi:voltage-gated potassium channel Kch
VTDPERRPSRRDALREEVGPSYELFIVAVSTLSLVNIVIFLGPFDGPTKEIAGIVDLLLSLILLADFFGRLWLAEPWQDYFFRRRGFLDLLGSLPFPVVRVFRVVRVYRGVVRVRGLGGRKLARQLIRERAQAALLAASFLVILVLEVGSMLVVLAEQNAPHANIRTGGDALWWAVVTVATVGYGDRYPVTTIGRLIGVVMIVVGVGLFGIFTGYLARMFLAPRAEDRPDQGTIPPSALPANQDLEAKD